jgi:hypothetical protein
VKKCDQKKFVSAYLLCVCSFFFASPQFFAFVFIMFTIINSCLHTLALLLVFVICASYLALFFPRFSLINVHAFLFS